MNPIVERLLQILLSLPAVLLAITAHEAAHGYAAYRLGDPTAKLQGRLSMNPLRHLDPIGFVALILFRFGWAKPVGVDSRYLKNPKRDMAIISLAGPISNFILAFIGVFLLGLYLTFLAPILTAKLPQLSVVLYLILYEVVLVNLGLGVFNLVPIPPLDGSKILYSFLPNRILYRILPYERYCSLALVILLWLGVLSVPISYVSSFIEGVFVWFWSLIFPAL